MCHHISMESRRSTMPTVRKLSAEEIQALESREQAKGKRERTTEQYDRMLSDFSVGDYLEVELDDGDKPNSVRYHLRQAAARRGLTLNFAASSGNVLEFRISKM